MLASEVLCEFNTTLCALEAKAKTLSRTLATLEGMHELFRLRTGSHGENRTNEAMAYFLEQQEEVVTELDNLLAAHKDVTKALERLDDKQRAVLSVVYLEGETVAEAAKRLGVSRVTAYGYHDAGLAILDGMIDWAWGSDCST